MTIVIWFTNYSDKTILYFYLYHTNDYSISKIYKCDEHDQKSFDFYISFSNWVTESTSEFIFILEKNNKKANKEEIRGILSLPSTSLNPRFNILFVSIWNHSVRTF